MAACDCDVSLPAPYKPIRLLGRGSYGQVWLCHQQVINERVAIKIITDPCARAVGASEAEAMQALKGLSNILTLYKVHDTPNALFLVTEYIDGVDLLSYMQERGCKPLNEEEARRIFFQLVFALHSMHMKGWVHRDVKCENLLLSADRRRVVLADFGFAAKWSSFQQLHESYGSLHYSAPEIVSSQPYTGPEVDIWSLGVTLYAMCTGRLPFGGKDEASVAERIREGAYAVPTGLSQPLRSLLASLMHAEPCMRATLGQIKRSRWLIGGEGYLLPSSESAPKYEEGTPNRHPSTAQRQCKERRSSPPAENTQQIDQQMSKSAEAEDTEKRTAHAERAFVTDSSVDSPTVENSIFTRLSRFALHGVKQFTLTRLLMKKQP